MTARRPLGARALTVNVADLLRRAGQRRDESLEGVIEGLKVLGSRVPDGAPVRIDLHLESLNEGVVVRGTTTAPWVAECRRCLRPVRSTLASPILEVYEPDPTEGETQPLDGVVIDIEPVAREAVLLELPLAPLCADDCAGLCSRCGADRNQGDCGCRAEVPDPRWSGLDGLRFDD